MLPDFATHQVLVPVFPCAVPSVVSTSPSLCLLATAGVAVHSTALATTGQFALLPAWVRRSRAPSPGFAGRADGLSLFGGAQLAIDTTLVSALRRDGTAREGAANRNDVAIRSAHRRKERISPEVAGAGEPCSVGHPCWRVLGVGRPKLPISCGLWQL